MTIINYLSFPACVIVSAALEAWTFDAKATRLEAKVVKFGLETKAWPLITWD